MEKPNDMGFGLSGKTARNLNKDGSFNVEFKGVSRWKFFDLFHTLISMPWWKFVLYVLSAFILTNILFACLYFTAGMDGFTGIDGKSGPERFWEAFFFSTQTLTTLGYGRIAPVSTAASVIAALESMIGLMAFAVATGLIYGRFSRPRNRLRFTTRAVMAPFHDGHAFMFRLANFSNSSLIEIEASINFSWHPEGKPMRNFAFLELEREKVNFLPSTWTVVHPVNEKSPLRGYSPVRAMKEGIEFIIMIKAFDQTSGQMLYARHSYYHHEILWGRKFFPIMEVTPDGRRIVDLGKMNETVAAEIRL